MSGTWVPAGGFTVINHGTAPLMVYAPNLTTVCLKPGERWPRPPGVYWTRTGGKTWRVEIVR